LDVTEYQTLAALGIPMTVVGYSAKLKTNSITLAGGESLDVVLDASNTTCRTTAVVADEHLGHLLTLESRVKLLI
jgi:hypothetical protein